MLVGSRAVARSRRRSLAAGARVLDAGESERDRGARRAPAGARAGRAHRRQQGILEPAAAASMPTTLVPRPETETVVEAALAAIDSAGRAHAAAAHRRSRHRLGRAPAGAALGIAQRLRHRHRHQLRRAAVARDNARRLRLARRALSSPATSARRSRGPFDLIVVQSALYRIGEIAALAPEVRDYDPRPALDGGADGLDCLSRHRRRRCRALLRPGGALVVELAPARRRGRRLVFAAGLAPSPAHVPILRVCRAPSSPESDIGRATVMSAKHWTGNGKKALGISAGTD